MVYANFSSNLPTGLQHFEFVDLTIKTFQLCILYTQLSVSMDSQDLVAAVSAVSEIIRQVGNVHLR